MEFFQPQYIVQAAQYAGVAAEAGEKEKDSQHEGFMKAAGSIFHPLIIETIGLWSPHTLSATENIAVEG